MKRNMLVAMAAATLMLVAGGVAEAGHRYGNRGYSRGYHQPGCYTGGSAYYGYRTSSRGAYSSWGFSARPRSYYHDTSHFDYHPPSLQRHRNHYHYVPGHYDYHRTGHWHR